MRLYQHQIEVIKKAKPILLRSSVVLLSCEMRTGKTLAAISLAAELGGRTLFVTKARAIDSVDQDVGKFTSCGHPLDIMVVSWDSLHKVDSGAFSCIICDEVHRAGGTFPKPSLRAKQVKNIFERTGAKAILLSGTPTVESICQLFHTFQMTCKGPWTQWHGLADGFYNWFREYGIPETIRIAGGREVKSYKRGQYDKIMKSVAPLTVSMTQKQAGFTVGAEVKVHRIENKCLLSLVEKFKRDQVVCLDEKYVVGASPAAVLQKMHMMEGGTVIDDENNQLILDGFDPLYKARFLNKRISDDRQYAVFTAYIAERELLISYFGDKATDDMGAFRNGRSQIFVGSMISWAEGVDLAWMNGAIVLYSLAWSGATYLQILDRMNNKLRRDKILIHVLCLAGGVGEKVYSAVSKKKNFNSKFYRDAT